MKSRMIFGFHAALARLKANPASVLELYVDEMRRDRRMLDLVGLAEVSGVRVLRVSSNQLEKYDFGSRHQGVVAVISSAPTHKSLDDLIDSIDGDLFLLVLDGVTDPHNLGACLRVADAAGVHAVVAPKNGAAGINGVVSKVASGAAEVIPYFMVTNLARTLQELKERDIWVIGTDGEAEETIFQFDLPKSVAWVLGAEGKGIRRLTRERCDQVVRIPMHGSVDSLNVSVASGICLFETVRRRQVALT